LGMALVVLFLLSAFMLTGVNHCHADVHNCAGDCAHSECCGGHSMPLLSAAKAVPIVRHYFSPYHAIEEQPAPRIFASSIFRPPRA